LEDDVMTEGDEAGPDGVAQVGPESLALAEKVALVSGVDRWHTAAVPRLGIPALWLSDGPNGVRGVQFAGAATSVCFPCGSALGATFDTELVAEVAAALGLEAARMGVDVLLAPTLNISRLPIAGRNFECFGEDPYLVSRLAVAYVAGLQSKGVAAVVKHFVCNDSERDRYSTSSEIDERALREVYLAPFAAAVREAGAWAVMSGYNLVNGVYACEHEELLRDVLKGEWGFTGPVVSDWFGTSSTVESALGGLDLEMPGPAIRWGGHLLDAIEGGKVPDDILDEQVARILELVGRRRQRPPLDDGSDPAPLVRRAAAEAAVLLRNEGAVLPFDPGRLNSLAVVGPNARTVQAYGGGSARVNAPYVVSPLDAIRRRVGAAVEVAYEPGCTIERAVPTLDARHLLDRNGSRVVEPVAVEYFDNLELSGEPVALETAPLFHFAWNGAPVEGLTPGTYSARLSARLDPGASGTAELGILGVGKMRLFVDGELVIDNWSSPLIAPLLFGRGEGQLTADIEVSEGRSVLVEVEFQSPDAAMARRALEQTPVPPTEREDSCFGPAGVAVGYRAPLPADPVGLAQRLARDADAVVVVVGTNEDWESEGFDRDSLALPGGQDALIASLARVNPNLVVVVNAGSPVAMPWADDVAAVLQLWLPGQEAGNALADVLFGDVNPSARLPVTVPVRLEDSGAARGYPALDGRLTYHEGVFVGHRYYDAAGLEPRYPFGHGLSYTSFRYGELVVEGTPDGEVLVRIDVTNSGERSGAEIVQLYVGELESSVERPVRELKGFTKLRLAMGETETARFVLEHSAFAHWDVARHDFVVEPGGFELSVGASSRDLRSKLTVEVAADGSLR
jgi:beta-glucosidase